jgi:hypothetical protein
MSVNDAFRITIDTFRVMLQIVASVTDNSRGVIYNLNVFIVQPPQVSLLQRLFFFITDARDKQTMGKLQFSGLNLGHVFNSKSGCISSNTLSAQQNKTA